MKTSRFNIIIEQDEDEKTFFLYNSNNGIVLKIDYDLKTALDEEKFDRIPEQILSILKKNKIVIPTNFNENNYLVYNSESIRFNKKESSYLIYTNSNCNLSCNYCNLKDNPSHVMSLNTASSITQFIKNRTKELQSSIVTISLLGTEPLLEPRTTSLIIKEIKHWAESEKITFRCILKTNGTLFSEDTFTNLVPYVSSFQITIDGHYEIHNARRNNSYDKVLDSVTRLIEMKKYVGLKYHVDHQTMNKISEFIDDLLKRGLKDSPYLQLVFSTVKPPYPCNYYVNHDELLLDSALFNLTWIKDNSRGIIKNYLDKSILLSNQFIECAFITEGTITINPEGSLFLCPVHLSDENMVGQILNDGSVNWFTSYYELLTRTLKISNSKCKECNYILNCMGGCPIMAKKSTGSYSKPYCGITKKIVPERIRNYISIKEQQDIETE